MRIVFQRLGSFCTNMAVHWDGAMWRLLQNSHTGLRQEWAELCCEHPKVLDGH